MRLRVLHETHYVYSNLVRAVAMEARLQPCNDEYQSRQRYRLQITPRTQIEEYTTFSDLLVQHWTLPRAEELHVVSESVVDVRERPLLPIQVPPLALDPITFYPYLHYTPLTYITPDIEAFAEQFRDAAAEDWYVTALAVREALHATLDFETGLTSTNSTADDVLRLQRGVCQDFTHLMIAVLRQLGIPARYASGYLNQQFHPQPPMHMSQSMSSNGMRQEMGNGMRQEMGQPDAEYAPLRGSGASHAWVEVYFGPGATEGWRGFDAANNLLVDDNFVRIGAGRDFHDVTPVKGVHKGPAEEALKVSVSVTRLG